ncbi:MAG: hypothetical protein QXN82_02620 [Desulfurococcaceae archaeon]
MNVGDLSTLKSHLQEFLVKKVPGMLSFLNMLCTLIHRVDCITLFLTSPSKLYLVILTHYRGDTVTADYTFTLMFLNPLVAYLKAPELAQQLLEYVKTGKDNEFIEIVMKVLVKGVSA